MVYRFPCRIGMCKTPIEVALSHLIASEVFPDVAVKAFLYPGAIAKAIISNTAIPSYDDLLNFLKFSYMEAASAATDLKNLEVLVGSYLCVAGAFLGLIRPGRASLFGVLLVLWGIARELVLQKHVATEDLKKTVSIYATMWIPVLSAFFSVRGDVRKLIRSCKAKRIPKQLRMYSKAKFK
ncbi:tail fiber [Olea europaea subsp. europaea]|uniref:Tail fiber n=1 Tax=Olea europaea subsp. europaea TaxID=158383 RepID=A0A8S0RHC8_OLEEU|nr:tail fiber [Olea europaea subsp. europaea]